MGARFSWAQDLGRKIWRDIHTVMIRVSQIAKRNLQVSRRSGGQTFALRAEWMGCCSHEARTPGGTPGLVFTAINHTSASSSCSVGRRRMHGLYVECTGCGSSAYLCASQDEINAGVSPTRPYRTNCSAPLSGPREP
jgi:hypothetical protein